MPELMDDGAESLVVERRRLFDFFKAENVRRAKVAIYNGFP